MCFAVHQLQIHDDVVQPLRHPVKQILLGIAGGLNTGVHLRNLLQHLQQEFPLHQRLAAGKSNASAAGGIVGTVPPQALRQILRRDRLSRNMPQAQRTHRHTFTAGHAVLVTAHRPAPAAVGTGSPYHQLRMRRQSLRIMAPSAPQGTALQKHRLPYARSVKHSQLFQVEYYASSHFSTPPLRRTPTASDAFFTIDSVRDRSYFVNSFIKMFHQNAEHTAVAVLVFHPPM